MNDLSEVPMKWTVRGNVPLSQLTYSNEWIQTEATIVFREYWHFADGELASNNVHALDRKGALMGAIVGAMQ